MGLFTRHIVPTRTPGELDAMEAAGRIVGKALLAVQAAAVPGVSTLEPVSYTHLTLPTTR